ncbi:3-hydroxybutyryl-CoA dehydratase [Burkholderia sp. Ax-1719]|nr:3-hydroxybutyryl-CoA dehydratase [Burkholderia sp. Ax-1719]
MPEILVTKSDGVAVVVINRESKRNALTMMLWRQLGETFSMLDQDPAVRAIVLTGSGASFCAGADISEFSQVRANAEQALEYESTYDGCCDAIAAVSKPTIAAVNGFCMGGGCNVAMACDFRFADPSAAFAIPAARLSIVYGVAGTARLLNLVGLSNAKWILFSGKRFDASRAHRLGFVDEIEPNVLAAAKVFAAELAQNAPLTMKGAKYILDHLRDKQGELSESTVQRMLDEAAQSYDYQEGRAAFAEKRAPRFTGT